MPICPVIKKNEFIVVLHRVSKNVPPSTCYNLDTHDPIMTILAEVLLRKYEIIQCFVFPPQLSSASALPCEIGNPEDSALVHCAHATQSNCCSAIDFFHLNHASTVPLAERIDYKTQGVIQQREYEL